MSLRTKGRRKSQTREHRETSDCGFRLRFHRIISNWYGIQKVLAHRRYKNSCGALSLWVPRTVKTSHEPGRDVGVEGPAAVGIGEGRRPGTHMLWLLGFRPYTSCIGLNYAEVSIRFLSLNRKEPKPRYPIDPAGKMRNYATATLAASLVARLASHLRVAAITRRQLRAGFSVHAEPCHSKHNTFLDQHSSQWSQ